MGDKKNSSYSYYLLRSPFGRITTCSWPAKNEKVTLAVGNDQTPPYYDKKEIRNSTRNREIGYDLYDEIVRRRQGINRQLRHVRI